MSPAECLFKFAYEVHMLSFCVSKSAPGHLPEVLNERKACSGIRTMWSPMREEFQAYHQSNELHSIPHLLPTLAAFVGSSTLPRPTSFLQQAQKGYVLPMFAIERNG
jgi:hypothetical protein